MPGAHFAWLSRLPHVHYTCCPPVSTRRLKELVEAWMERVDAKVIREFGKSRMERFEQDKAVLRLLTNAPLPIKPSVNGANLMGDNAIASAILDRRSTYKLVVSLFGLMAYFSLVRSKNRS